MELLQVMTGEISIYKSLFDGGEYFIFQDNIYTTYSVKKEEFLKDVIIVGKYRTKDSRIQLVKTIEVSQLKLLVLLKPTMTIEELLDEENRLFECS